MALLQSVQLVQIERIAKDWAEDRIAVEQAGAFIRGWVPQAMIHESAFRFLTVDVF